MNSYDNYICCCATVIFKNINNSFFKELHVLMDEGAIRLVYIPRLVMPPSQVKNSHYEVCVCVGGGYSRLRWVVRPKLLYHLQILNREENNGTGRWHRIKFFKNYFHVFSSSSVGQVRLECPTGIYVKENTWFGVIDQVRKIFNIIFSQKLMKIKFGIQIKFSWKAHINRYSCYLDL